MGNRERVENDFGSARGADLEDSKGVHIGEKWWIISSWIDTDWVKNTSKSLLRENKSIGKEKWSRFSQLWKRIIRIKFRDRSAQRYLWVFGKYAEKFKEMWF